jgi:hypothetical protein
MKTFVIECNKEMLRMFQINYEVHNYITVPWMSRVIIQLDAVSIDDLLEYPGVVSASECLECD